MPTTYAYFGISGDFEAKKFAASIPLEPSQCLQKHSSNPTHGIPDESLIRYCETENVKPLVDLYDLTERITSALEPHADSIAAAIKAHQAQATLQVVLYFPTSEEVSTPILGVSERVIRFLGAVGASIDLDSYRDY